MAVEQDDRLARASHFPGDAGAADVGDTVRVVRQGGGVRADGELGADHFRQHRAGPESRESVTFEVVRRPVHVGDDESANAGPPVDPWVGSGPARAAHQADGAAVIQFLAPHAEAGDSAVGGSTDALDEFLALDGGLADLVRLHLANRRFREDAFAFEDPSVRDEC